MSHQIIKQPNGKYIKCKPKVIFLPTENPNHLYRFDGRYGNIIEQEFKIIKKTSCGVRVLTKYGWPEPETKFINNNWVKKFAHETREAALKSFIKRKERHIRILTARLASVKDLHEAAVSSLDELNTKENSND